MTLMVANVVSDLGDATTCKTQGCCKRHVSPWRIVSRGASSRSNSCLSDHRTVGAGIAKLVSFNQIVQGAYPNHHYNAADADSYLAELNVGFLDISCMSLLHNVFVAARLTNL